MLPRFEGQQIYYKNIFLAQDLLTSLDFQRILFQHCGALHRSTMKNSIQMMDLLLNVLLTVPAAMPQKRKFAFCKDCRLLMNQFFQMTIAITSIAAVLVRQIIATFHTVSARLFKSRGETRAKDGAFNRYVAYFHFFFTYYYYGCFS